MTDNRCPSLYGPEQIQCVKQADELHEWHNGSGTYPDDDADSPGEVYGAAWLSHWEPGLTDRKAEP
jgi:hypothetical protein